MLSTNSKSSYRVIEQRNEESVVQANMTTKNLSSNYEGLPCLIDVT
jgi:hypothetical protein